MSRSRLVIQFLFLLAAASARAEHLATERFTADLGLLSDHVTAIAPDSRGFVWIGTNEGLSRFDGAAFENYTTRDGLPGRRVNGIVEDHAGGIWIATDGGLAHIAPNAARIERAGALRADDIALAPNGNVWIASGTSLYRADPHRASGAPQLAASLPVGAIYCLAASPNGDLWMGTSQGIWRYASDRRLTRYLVGSDPRFSEDHEQVRTLGVTPDGVVWFSSRGIFAFCPDDGSDTRTLRSRVRGQFHVPRRPGEVTCFVGADDLSPGPLAAGPIATSDGSLWAATPYAVARLRGSAWSLLAEESGLAFDELTSIAVDRSGAVWVGTIGDGVLRLRPSGFVSYSDADGLRHKRVTQVFELRDGTLAAASGNNRALQFHDGTRFRGVVQQLDLRYWGWGWGQIVVPDREGDVWIGTGEALLRYRNARTFTELTSRVPVRYTEADGLGGNDIFRLWEDSRGDLWIGSFGAITLTRFDRASGRFVRLPPREGLPHRAPTAFAEDRQGNVWIGWYDGGVTRMTRDGGARFFGAGDGIPPGFVHALYVDAHGALWIATASGGIGIIDHPGREPLVCRRVTRADGLSSNAARALVQANDGAMWAGTDRGIDRIAPGGTITHFGRGDGLSNPLVTSAFRDRSGMLWFGTVEGISSVAAYPAPAAPAAKTLITRVVADGVSLPVSQRGSESISGLELGPATRRLEFRFVAPQLQENGPVRYSFRLAGVDDGWTDTTDGVVRFERLPARDLRFEVRATAPDGTVSPVASAAFRVALPLWRRWWFLAGSAAAVLALLVMLHRIRVSSLLAVERMRTRIATDLHDDLGSSLSRMSLLTEVARRQVGEGAAAGILDDIGNSARTLIGTLGDNIWAIDPRVDDLQSFIARGRHHAFEMLDPAGIAVRFEVQEGLQGVRLPADGRRQLYLILKEALNNVVRHSRARHAVISIGVDDGRLRVEVADDGCGFDAGAAGPHESGTGGRGLGSMRARAERLGGIFTIDSAPQRGTRVRFAVPV